MNSPTLHDALKGYLPADTPDADIHEAASNLSGFVRLLLDIDREQRATKAKGAK